MDLLFYLQLLAEAKRYTEVFLLHFSIKILVKFLKVGGQLPPHAGADWQQKSRVASSNIGARTMVTAGCFISGKKFQTEGRCPEQMGASFQPKVVAPSLPRTAGGLGARSS